MTVTEQLRSDITSAMKGGEKDRVGALRLVLSELQKAEKEGGDDELTVLRRERKRRLEAAAQFRDGGRPELADQEESEAQLIAGYLPAELSDEDLDGMIAAAIAETGASSPRDMGQVMKAVMAASGGRADGKRASARVREALGRSGRRGSGQAIVRRTIELDNAVAAELAGSQDAVLRTLESHLDADVFLRGNVLTLEGDDAAVESAAAVVRELSDLISQGHEIAPGTVEAVARALDEHASPFEILEDVVWRHRATKVGAQDRQREALRRLDPRQHDHVRNRPAGTGKTFLAVALAAAALSRREVNRIILTRPAVEAGERLGFLPGDLMAKVDPYLRPLFDALHDMLDPERVSQHLERGVIEVAPLAFMRGRSLNDSFIILDEAQNTTPEQMKMFLTRLGFGSKMVVTGDITQVDLPRDQDSGLIVVSDVLSSVEGIEFVRFGDEDVVRHKLVRRIVAAYNEHTQRAAPELRPRKRA